MVDAVLWSGQRALLLEFGTLADVLRFDRHIRQAPLAGQIDAVAAARTLLLTFRSRRDAQNAAKQVRRVRPKPMPVAESRNIEIPVHYDGADLDTLADQLGMSAQALIDWHGSVEWVGAFSGFAPGFTYCVPEELTRRKRPRKLEHTAGASVGEVPRRESPRTSVPAGSVALAGEFSAVYPRSSPGGWRLIGTTDAPVWDLERSQPALVRPGDRVRYVPAERSVTLASRSSAASPRSTTVGRSVSEADVVLEILAPGVQTLVQDSGRPGYGDLGVPRSGAADVQAMRQANQLVGNDDSAAVLEVLYGGLELTVRQTSVLAVTGAETELLIAAPGQQERSNMAFSGTGAAAEALAEETLRSVPPRAPFWIFPGERLTMAGAGQGIRSYVAVSGGLAAEAVLGSCATDTLSGLGPAPVQAGDTFALVGAPSGFVGIADVARTALPQPEEPALLRFVPGPRDDWFAARGSTPGLVQLQSQTWRVSQDSNRVGVRLEPEEAGTAVQRGRDQELRSEGLVRGALQVPPNGEPVLFLADHPITGGYPVIGVVVRADLGLAAQLPPGAPVRFQAVDADTLAPL